MVIMACSVMLLRSKDLVHAPVMWPGAAYAWLDGRSTPQGHVSGTSKPQTHWGIRNSSMIAGDDWTPNCATRRVHAIMGRPHAHQAVIPRCNAPYPHEPAPERPAY